MPKLKDDRVRITQWDYKSPMNPKTLLGGEYKSDRHYRFVRPDNVDKMREVYGYSVVPGKKFKEMVVMETSKEHHHELQKEVQDRTAAKSRALDDSLRREVRGVGQGKIDFED